MLHRGEHLLEDPHNHKSPKKWVQRRSPKEAMERQSKSSVSVRQVHRTCWCWFSHKILRKWVSNWNLIPISQILETHFSHRIVQHWYLIVMFLCECSLPCYAEKPNTNWFQCFLNIISIYANSKTVRASGGVPQNVYFIRGSTVKASIKEADVITVGIMSFVNGTQLYVAVHATTTIFDNATTYIHVLKKGGMT